MMMMMMMIIINTTIIITITITIITTIITVIIIIIIITSIITIIISSTAYAPLKKLEWKINIVASRLGLNFRHSLESGWSFSPRVNSREARGLPSWTKAGNRTYISF